MTDHEFIALYQKRIDRIRPECRGDHGVDASGIHSRWLGETVTIPLDVCLKVIALHAAAQKYVHGLRPGARVTLWNYGRLEEGEVVRVSYKRKAAGRPLPAGKRLVSSVALESGHFNYKPDDICYAGESYADIRDAWRHTSGYFLSFSAYDRDMAIKTAGAYEKAKGI